MAGIKIESGIPRPKSSYCKYPFSQMEIGDSFAVPLNDPISKRRGNSIASAASWHGKRKGGKFTLRKIEENGETVYRIWRIA